MALLNILSTVIVAAINFITIPIFTRMLDTAGYGIVTVYTAWVQIFTVFIGLKADGSIGSAKANLPEEEQDSYQFSILTMSLGTFAFIFILTMVFMNLASGLLSMSPAMIVCMLAQSFGAFLVAFFNMRFIFRKQAQKNFLVSVGLCLATTLLSVALILWVFSGDDAYLGRALGLMVPNVLIGLGLFIALAVSQRGRIKVKYWRFCLVLTLPLILHGLSQLVLAQTGKIATQQIWGDSLAGVYGIAVTIVGLVNAIYLALNNAFVPFMYDDLGGKTDEATKQRHFNNYTVMFTMGVVAFTFMAPEILKLMSTPAYWDAIEILPPLIVGQYCVFLYSFPVNYEFFKMRTSSIAVGTLLAAALNIALVVWLVPKLGMMGAALATMVAYLLLFLFHLCIARFRLGDRNYPIWKLFAGLGVVVLFALLAYPLDGFPIVRWVVGLAILAAYGIRLYRVRSIF